MTELYVVYACLGVVALGLALVSRSLRQLPVSEPLIALVLGVVLGPLVTGLVTVDERTGDLLLLEGCRVLLSASVMAAALRFPTAHLRDVVRPVVVLLVVAMPLAAVITGAVSLVVGLPITLALVLGCCLCPTDPVLAASVVTGDPAERDLPGRLRRMMTVESGANDGLALPLVVISMAVALHPDEVGAAVGRGLAQVLGGAAIGAVLGAACGWGLRGARRDSDLEPGPQLVVTLLLAVATLGVTRVVGAGAVFGVFVAGLVYGSVVDRDPSGQDGGRSTQDVVDEAVNRYAVLPVFVLLGVLLPWRDWVALGPAAVLLVAGVLLLRRPPVVLALARPLGLRARDAAFAGWFGPMGVSALFYLADARHEGLTDPRLFAAGTLAVAASVVAAGTSSSPLRTLYRRTSPADA